ncbi:MAG: cyclic nucleotide-binding domain-containing protein [Proteobacteria bacterium]|jgi:CRP-like cAMP-binding protein|nr:cyclic nucleotide-binding domain-containing protein [Pseudomonadota bacterium]
MLRKDLSEVELFHGLSSKQLSAIKGAGSTKQLAAGATIFTEGDDATHVFCVLHGRVEVTITLGDHHDQAPVHVCTPGDVFGEFALFHQVDQRTATVRALKEVSIFCIENSCLKLEMESDHELGYRVMHNLSAILVRKISKTTRELRASLMW